MAGNAGYTKEITPTTGYLAVGVAGTVFTGYVTAKSTNTGTVSVQDSFGNVTVMIATEYFQLNGIDLSTLNVKSSDGTAVVKLQGNVFQNVTP